MSSDLPHKTDFSGSPCNAAVGPQADMIMRRMLPSASRCWPRCDLCSVQTAPQIDLKTPSPRVAPTYPKVEPTDPKVSMISCNGFPVASHASGSAQKATFEFVAHHRHVGDREKARV